MLILTKTKNISNEMSKRQDFIKELLEKAKKEGISQAYVSRRVGMTPQNLGYHLNEAAELDLDIYNSIIKVIGRVIEVEAENLKEPRSKYIAIDEIEKHNSAESIQYKIEGQVPAGISDIIEYNDWQESEDLFFDPRTHFYLRVDHEFGYSMMPLVSPGDLVLCSTKEGQAKDGDMVAARWDKTKGALKILTINPNIKETIVLTSYNQAVAPIFVSKKEIHLYKVVLIKKRK